MASRFRTEDSWLYGVRKHLKAILRKPAAYVAYWDLEREEGLSVSAGLKRVDFYQFENTSYQPNKYTKNHCKNEE